LKKNVLSVLLVMILCSSILLVSCVSNSTTSTSTTTSLTTATTSSVPQTSTTSASQTDWWSEFGEPQYGGTLNIPIATLRGLSLDVLGMQGGNIDLWYDALFGTSWTVSRDDWSFEGMFTPEQYVVGNLVESWEWTDATTLTLNLRHGVKFQNKAPVNGRELTATDVQAHYDRVMGTGGGYTQPAPAFTSRITNWEKVTAVDKYTVTFKFKTASASNLLSIADQTNLNNIEAPEWVALGGTPGSTTPTPNPLTDWKTVVGSGPWMLSDFVAGASLTYNKNPDYWGTDQRYPKNKIPYTDSVNLVIIADVSTKVAAMRTGKFDVIFDMDWQKSADLLKTNSDLLKAQQPAGSVGINLIADKTPFTDIRVRQALQMSIDRPTIAKSLYGGTASSHASGQITQIYKGYAFAYEDWPQELKDAYTYNPTAAKTLLAEAGFPDGFKTNVVASTGSDLNLLQIFKAYFLDIGVDMEIKTMDDTGFLSFKRGGKADQMSFEQSAWTTPPITSTITHFYSKGSDAGPEYGVNDPAYDALVNQCWAATTAEGASRLTQQIDQYYLEQHWQVQGPEFYNFVLWEPYLKGYSGEYPGFWGEQNLFATIWIDQSLK